jgi:hypothetical protein
MVVQMPTHYGTGGVQVGTRPREEVRHLVPFFQHDRGVEVATVTGHIGQIPTLDDQRERQIREKKEERKIRGDGRITHAEVVFPITNLREGKTEVHQIRLTVVARHPEAAMTADIGPPGREEFTQRGFGGTDEVVAFPLFEPFGNSQLAVVRTTPDTVDAIVNE